jgi:hypothetical protein
MGQRAQGNAARASWDSEKLCVTVAAEVAARLRRLAFEYRFSESSIVEIALRLLFEQESDSAKLGEMLREHGASLRRRVIR